MWHGFYFNVYLLDIEIKHIQNIIVIYFRYSIDHVLINTFLSVAKYYASSTCPVINILSITI